MVVEVLVVAVAEGPFPPNTRWSTDARDLRFPFHATWVVCASG